MDQHKEELATLEAVDSGAVYTLALKTHVGFSVETFRYYAGWCDKIQVEEPYGWERREGGMAYNSEGIAAVFRIASLETRLFCV